jgi:hypothetical protein
MRLTDLSPARFVDQLVSRRIFVNFASVNGLFYFGNVDARSDDHTPIRGFTMSARVADRNLMAGAVGDRDVTIVQRTDETPKARPVTWVIVSIKLSRSFSSALFMSHGYPHNVYQSAFIGLVRSEHVALEYRLDANFLIYAHRADVEDLKACLTDSAVSAMIGRPGFDYELSGEYLNVCLRTDTISVQELNGLLARSIAVSEAIDPQ